MRNLNMEEICFVSGAGDLDDGCPPPRDTDIIDCAQSEVGNTLNDLADLARNNAVMDAGQSIVTSTLDWWFGDVI